jgi:GAF domain-containing protein
MAARGDFEYLIQSAMVELADGFASGIDVEQTLSRVTALAVGLIDGADYADVMLIGDDGFRSVAPSARVVIELDEAQLRLDEGPCLAAATGHSTIHSDNLEAEARWPQFAAAAVAAGVKSMLSFQLFTHRSGSGALNLLSQRPYAFNPECEAMGAMLATHAAIALMHADQQRQFDSALASRDLIGQAKGMIMKEHSVNAVFAFEMLVKLSQNSNTPLREIAQRVVESLG